MSHKRLTTWQKATALVPLALLSGAWTASLAVTSTASAATKHPSLPGGANLPNGAIKSPASLTVPGAVAPGVPSGAAESVVSSASTSGIPAAALAAYQRAAEVINQADPSCNLGWQLIAAIGRVESDHGRYGGNVLTKDGISRPGIFGIPLDGTNGTAKVTDTDGGQYDGDPVYDRAVGPMQFIPSTWSVVGVDADGDGKRNPQDINDAALATAVYLCAGNEDLSTPAGQRSAVYRYNHNQDYVNLVLSIMRAYMAGEFSAVPNGSTAPAVFAPVTSSTSPARGKKHHATRAQTSSGGGSTLTGGGSGGGATSGSGTGSGGGGGSTSPSGGTSDPVKTTTNTVDNTVNTTTQTVDKTKEATDYCTSQLGGTGATQDQIDKCVNAYLDGGKSAADAVIQNILDALSGLGLP